MKIVNKTADWQAIRANIPSAQSIGFVPTMGCLHEGHLSLLKNARVNNDCLVLSMFVNRTQFNDEKDYLNYPRVFEQDVLLAQEADVDYLLMPEHTDLYPDSYTYQVVETLNSLTMEGAYRPGHFQGMLTVVLKLLLLVKPQRAYFGEKDYQQLTLVQGLVKAFFLDTEIIPCSIIREASGLPLSSRNKLLNVEEKRLAEKFAETFKQTDLSAEKIAQQLEKLGITVEYVQDVDSRRFCAVKIGNIRLIDNRELRN